METEVMHARVRRARVGRLATVSPQSPHSPQHPEPRPRPQPEPQPQPHLVPCCFALDGGAMRIVTAVDQKPKSTMALRRLDNVRANPWVAMLVDHYDDRDWSQLWWVRVDGQARVIDDGEAEQQAAVASLVAKYEQYREQPPAGAVIAIEQLRWRAWP